jgi:hypothetical protein
MYGSQEIHLFGSFSLTENVEGEADDVVGYRNQVENLVMWGCNGGFFGVFRVVLGVLSGKVDNFEEFGNFEEIENGC